MGKFIVGGFVILVCGICILGYVMNGVIDKNYITPRDEDEESLVNQGSLPYHEEDYYGVIVVRKYIRYSSEWFRESILIPTYKRFMDDMRDGDATLDDTILIDFDGCGGLSTIWIKDAFDGAIIRDKIHFHAIAEFTKFYSEEGTFLTMEAEKSLDMK